MSKQIMKKYRIKSYREVASGILMCDDSGDEWLLNKDNVLFHKNTRGKCMEFHRQRNVSGLFDCLKYIRKHSKNCFIKPNKLSTVDRMFSKI